MTIKPFLIGEFSTGLQNNVAPYLLPEDAFEELEDVYCWRSQIRKRFGYCLLGGSHLNARLRIKVGVTDVFGDISGTVLGSIFKVGQGFSIGAEIFTVKNAGLAVMLDTGLATTKTYDTANGNFIIQGAAPITDVFFYPVEPVMGLRKRESGAVNLEETIAFDTQFSYRRVGTAWEQVDSTLWTGSNSDFFWSMNGRGPSAQDTYFYVVNYKETDNIKYLPTGSSTWTNLRPQLNTGVANRFLETSRVLLRYKDRHVCLNTKETLPIGGLQTFPMRARFSQQGDPTNPANSWIDDVAGRGGFIDAPTTQQIITADIIKDRLVVYFERSTWELVYTGFPSVPFKWQQINDELGCESTFSVVGFDDGVLGVGNVGIHMCDGVGVARTDSKIPDEVFRIQNASSGTNRVYGIRNYLMELVYWTFPSLAGDATFPNRILVFNHKNNTWAFFNDSFTCFGTFQKETGVTWATVGLIYPTWNVWNDPWNSFRLQSSFPDIVAGNQQGFVVVLDSDNSCNAPSLSITDLIPAVIPTDDPTLTIIDHNLLVNDYVKLTDAEGIVEFNDIIFRVKKIVDDDTIILDNQDSIVPIGIYSGGGLLTRVSNINIRTKQYNPTTTVGRQFSIPYTDFLLDTTAEGEVSLSYFTDSNAVSISGSTLPGTILGNSTLATYSEVLFGSSAGAQYEWHRFYMQSEGRFLQMQLFLNDAQMRTATIAESNFVLNSMILYVQPAGRLI